MQLWLAFNILVVQVNPRFIKLRQHACTEQIVIIYRLSLTKMIHLLLDI